MSVNIEDILLLKAQQDAANQNDNNAAVAAGALIGTGGGVLAGTPVHHLGQLGNKLKDRLAEGQGLTRSRGQQLRSRVRPGARMAGGLVGAILGGGLGEVARQEMTAQSPAASLLAKLQTGGLTASEEAELTRVLTDTYSGVIGA